MNDLQPISPREAVQTYLRERETELADASIKAHDYRLRHFLRWCDSEGIENMNDLGGRQLHEYKLWRREDGGLNRVTLKTQMDTIRVFVRFCERVDAVQADLSEAVMSPSLKPGENQREVMLDGNSATDLLAFLKRFRYASFPHTLLSLMWQTGLRTGSLHALDLRDIDHERERIHLRHRPDSGTPLKNGGTGERLVALTSEMSELVQTWVEHHRPDVTDENGRHALFTTDHGRACKTTIRETAYRWTRPCEYTGECPHSQEIEDCEATDDRRKTASKCPSSVSPHAVRRGSITHHLTNDIPETVVSDRMNVSRDVLSKHYDERSEEVKVEQRREYLNNL